jgi:hypothetical protein
MGLLFLKMLAGFIGGLYFGRLHQQGVISYAKGIALTFSFSLIMVFLIDLITKG